MFFRFCSPSPALTCLLHPSTVGFLLVPVFMLCEWFTISSMRFCVWFCFFNYKMKTMVPCIETEQFVKQSVFSLWDWAMASFLVFYPKETVLLTIFNTKRCKPCAWCTAEFATAAAQPRVVWSGSDFWNGCCKGWENTCTCLDWAKKAMVGS